MRSFAHSYLPSLIVKSPRWCLACGNPLPPRHRRYCAMSCRQNLLASLNRRSGILRALSTRYATFYFTNYVIIMDLLLYDTEQIYSYMLPRSAGKKPVDDFCELSNSLGAAWWNERNRTKKRYLANQSVLLQASRPGASRYRVIPIELTVPAVSAVNLISLGLHTSDLSPHDIEKRIKRAYRTQVKKHHPDIGGQTQAFIKIQEAYEKLLYWAKHPTYTRRRGFPDKWLYEGAADRWIQPIVSRTVRR